MGISLHKFVAGGLGRHTRTRVHGQIHGQNRPPWTDPRPRWHTPLLRNSPLEGFKAALARRAGHSHACRFASAGRAGWLTCVACQANLSLTDNPWASWLRSGEIILLRMRRMVATGSTHPTGHIRVRWVAVVRGYATFGAPLLSSVCRRRATPLGLRRGAGHTDQPPRSIAPPSSTTSRRAAGRYL
jgi:hypothetical protein